MSHTYSNAWQDVHVVKAVVFNNTVHLDSACIVFVDLHNCMEIKNYIFGYFFIVTNVIWFSFHQRK